MAEFALVLPVFLVMIFGLFDVGRLVYIDNAVAQGAREAARWGSVQARSASAAGRASIATYAQASMVAVPSPIATATCQDGTGTILSSCAPNDILVVKVTATVSMVTPLIAQVLGPLTVTSTSKVAVNQ